MEDRYRMIRAYFEMLLAEDEATGIFPATRASANPPAR